MKVDAIIAKVLLAEDLNDHIRAILVDAQARLLASVSVGDYNKGFSDKPASEVQDEKLQHSFHELLQTFPFLQNFSVGEYLSFAVEYEKIQLQSTKRKRGRPKKTDEDPAKQIQKDIETILKCYKGLRLNMITRKIEYYIEERDGKPHWEIVEGGMVNELTQDLSWNHGVFVPKERAAGAFTWAAKKNPFEPTASLMDEARDLYPDLSFEEAQQFLSNIGSFLFGVLEDEPEIDGQTLRNRFMSRFFINVAYLARHPGSPPHWLPIIIGDQGCGKSQLCRTLVPEKSNLFCQITHSVERLMREPQLLHNGMILEFPEIDEYFTKRSAIEQLKQMITKSSDLTRFPYDRNDTQLLRRFAFIGTSNKPDIFRDGSGEGERRYLPIQVPSGFRLPWRELDEGLNMKIWAAADIIACCFNRETSDSAQFFSFDPKELDLIYQWQKNYSASDPWEAALYSYISIRSEFTVEDALTHAIEIPVAQQSAVHTRRLNELLRRKFGQHLKHTKQARRGGRRVALWHWISKPPMEGMLEETASNLSEIDTANKLHDF